MVLLAECVEGAGARESALEIGMFGCVGSGTSLMNACLASVRSFVTAMSCDRVNGSGAQLWREQKEA